MEKLFDKQGSSSTLVDGIAEIHRQSDKFLSSRSDADLEREIASLDARPITAPRYYYPKCCQPCEPCT